MRTIPSTAEDLGGEVLRSSAECVCRVVILHVELAQPEITKGDVARVIEKDVFGLEVAVGTIDEWTYVIGNTLVEVYCLPIDDIEIMKVLEGEEKFCAVKTTALFVELLFALEMVEELSSIDESTSRGSGSA